MGLRVKLPVTYNTSSKKWKGERKGVWEPHNQQLPQRPCLWTRGTGNSEEPSLELQ